MTLRLNPSVRCAVLAVLFLWAFARLMGLVAHFGEESLQMDFSPYYTAGESLNAGLSPYKNYVTRNPPIWDGVIFYKHSRFSYPPPAATFFRPWAMLPYGAAKRVWMGFSILCIGLAMGAAAKAAGVRITPERVLFLGAVAALFYPLTILLERGQIDAVTLLFITIAVWLLVRKGEAEWGAGMAFSFATLLKMHCVFILPFLILRKKWKAAAGYGAGVIFLVLFSLVCNGVAVSREYAFERFPTMSKYGTDQGSVESRLPVPLARALLAQAPKGMRIKGGKAYKLETLQFIYNATLVRAYLDWFGDRGLNVSHQTLLALGTLSVFFLILAAAEFFCFRKRTFAAVEEFSYWQIVFVAVLLAAPTTFAMNVVWLLPVTVVMLHFVLDRKPGRFIHALWLVMCVGGLLLAGMPDPTRAASFFTYKYIVAELLIFFSLLGMLLSRS